MVLTIDIGNSLIKCAVFEADMIIQKYVFEKSKADKEIATILFNHPNIKNGILSSVGKIDDIIFLKKLKKRITIVEVNHKSILPFNNKYTTPHTLGQDRMVLAAGATLLFPKKNRLIIDVGTCITYDFVNQEDEYLGGAISPGLTLRYKALHNYTEKLPLLSPKIPNNFIGNSTDEAIQSGVVIGIINEIDGFISQYSLKYKDLTIILTGGDTDFLAKSIKSTIFANSNFLLESLNALFTYFINKND